MPDTAPAPRLLRTKLYLPRVHSDLVARPRLIQALNAGLSRPLTLIAAPAGSGKTTLLSAWLAQVAAPAAWVSLDERDNDPARFWDYVIAALQTLWPAIGATAAVMLRTPQAPPIETILTELLNDLAGLAESGAAPAGFVLALDDYHAITATEIHAGVAFLVDNLGPGMHLALASRSEPPLPLARWRARRLLTELRPADLRFTRDEAADFLARAAGLALPADDVAALEALTEGWAAGLQMAGLSMQSAGGDIAGFVRSFSGQQRYIFDYLAQEVFSRQPADLQDFLLRTSVLDRLSGPLCDAVLARDAGAPGQTVLEALERANLFIVPLDQSRRWFRYHHLFADFLRARLAQVADAGEISALRRRASAWLADQGFMAEAVDQAMAAGDFDMTTDLVTTAAPLMFYRNELITLLGWLDVLPADCVRQRPYLSMAYAWALLATGRPDAVEAHLVDVERALGVVADGSPASLALPANIRGGLAEVATLRSNLAFQHMDLPRVLAQAALAQAYLADDVEQLIFNTRPPVASVLPFNVGLVWESRGNLAAAAEALAEAVERGRAADNYHVVLLALGHLGAIQTVQGQLRRAAETLQEALQAASPAGGRTSPMAGAIHVGLGAILLEWGDLDAAQKHLEQGIELGQQWSSWGALLAGRLELARLAAARGDLPAARAHQEAAAGVAERIPGHVARAEVEAQRAQLWAQHGGPDGESAACWATQLAPQVAGPMPFQLERQAIALARVSIALDCPAEALTLADRLLAAAEAGDRLGRAVEILIVRSLALDALGQHGPAREALRRAHALADPEGYVQLFAEAGRPADRQGAPAPAGAALPEPLSARELEVLRLLAAGLGNQEIAGRLVVSLNTVKSHVKNIYAKLDVSNRTQALARARDLGLL